MGDSRASLAGLIDETGAQLDAVSTRLKNCAASADEIAEGSRLAFALAEALKLYAEKMPKNHPSGRHSLRQRPPSSR